MTISCYLNLWVFVEATSDNNSSHGCDDIWLRNSYNSCKELKKCRSSCVFIRSSLSIYATDCILINFITNTIPNIDHNEDDAEKYSGRVKKTIGKQNTSKRGREDNLDGK